MTHMKRSTGCCSWPSVRVARALACSDTPLSPAWLILSRASGHMLPSITTDLNDIPISQERLHAPSCLEYSAIYEHCSYLTHSVSIFTTGHLGTWYLSEQHSVMRKGPCCCHFIWSFEDLCSWICLSGWERWMTWRTQFCWKAGMLRSLSTVLFWHPLLFGNTLLDLTT